MVCELPDGRRQGTSGPAAAFAMIPPPARAPENDPMDVLHTPRLTLRPLCAADEDDLAALFSDPEVMRYISNGRPRTREQTHERLARMLDYAQRHGIGMWSMRLKPEGTFVGRCGINDL